MTEEQYEALSEVQKRAYEARVELSNALFNMTQDGRLDIGNIEAFSQQIHFNLRRVESILKAITGED